jgi:hypothetical protein
VIAASLYFGLVIVALERMVRICSSLASAVKEVIVTQWIAVVCG